MTNEFEQRCALLPEGISGHRWVNGGWERSAEMAKKRLEQKRQHGSLQSLFSGMDSGMDYTGIE